jgi:hypothetical protein
MIWYLTALLILAIMGAFVIVGRIGTNYEEKREAVRRRLQKRYEAQQRDYYFGDEQSDSASNFDEMRRKGH